MRSRLFTTSCGVTLVIALTACGGGGGGSGVTATPAPVAANPDPVVEPIEVTQTSDIVVSDTFSFQSKPSQIAFEVDTATRFDYVTVCASTGTQIDLSNCMLRAPLIDGQLSHVFPVTSATQNLGAVIWDYEALNDRQQHFWSIADGLTFAIN